MRQQQQQKTNVYTKQDEIIFCQIQPLKKAYVFPIIDIDEIQKAVYSTVSLEIMLKHIHHKYHDEGLRYTLIHQLYGVKSEDLQFYVPELVYIAIKKQCKPMRRLLSYRGASNQSLRRLILWNLKAFTVLMKERDPKLKEFVQGFEKELIQSNKKKDKFNHAEKCIAMLTTASLILKTLPKQQLKPKLQKFIKRFNSQYLSNTEHTIIIPFRKEEGDLFHSDYIVGIVQDDCSCFPTRKRVPYRIIIETIDRAELINEQPNEMFFKQKRYEKKNKAVKDLFDEVVENVEKLFSAKLKSFIIPDTKTQYPFVVDHEQIIKNEELAKFVKVVVEGQQKEKQKEKTKQSSTIEKLTRSILRPRSNRLHEDAESECLSSKLKMKNDSNHERFKRIYIPTIPSSIRKSISITNLNQSRRRERELRQTKRRWSQERRSSGEDVKIYQQEKNWAMVKTDNSRTVWGQLMSKKVQKYKKTSFFHSFKSLKMHNVVVKGGDDLRQEIICMQLIYKIRDIITAKGLNVMIKPYEIIVLSENSGILEFVANSISIDGLKKEKNMDLPEFFRATFETEEKYTIAKDNFIRSLVGSSVLTYILKLKDRHNGNILLDCEGNIIHIDFGFILGMSPGGLNFESSPFKLTEEYIDLMNGKDSYEYKLFCTLFCDSMLAIRKRSEQLCLILDIMKEESDLQCFQKFEISVFRDRFKPWLSDEKYRIQCQALIEKSCMNPRTVNYDTFQYYTNGIQP